MVTEPHVTVLSGALASGSRTERLARWCQRQCVARGATATLFRGDELEFPFYRYGHRHSPRVTNLLDDLVRADGIILLTPSYHGSLSGLLKNALDYVNELAGDERPFFDGRAVGCVAVAGGEQGAASTLAALRAIVHAMRGWPTPLGVSVATDTTSIRQDGTPGDERIRMRLEVMLDQVLLHASSRQQLGSLPNELAAPRP